jgi:hypothetical protein
MLRKFTDPSEKTGWSQSFNFLQKLYTESEADHTPCSLCNEHHQLPAAACSEASCQRAGEEMMMWIAMASVTMKMMTVKVRKMVESESSC